MLKTFKWAFSWGLGITYYLINSNTLQKQYIFTFVSVFTPFVLAGMFYQIYK